MKPKYILHARRSAGQSIIELALVLPLLLLMVAGVAEASKALNDYIGIIEAAREGARLTARGNVYTQDQLRQVMRGQSSGLDLDAYGAVAVTIIQSDPSSGIIEYQTTALINSPVSKFNAADMAALYSQVTNTSNQTYLRKEKLALIEVFYDSPTMFHFFYTQIPMYTYAVMQIQAPY